jgi:hypothetical protein
MVTPADIPFARPDKTFIIACALLLLQVPPEVGSVNVTDEPTHR